MPCNSDHMRADGRETESRNVAQYIKYLRHIAGNDVPAWVLLAATQYYGCVGRLDELTAMLCSECEEAPVHRIEAHQELDNWWRSHQEWDDRKDFQKEYVKQLGI